MDDKKCNIEINKNKSKIVEKNWWKEVTCTWKSFYYFGINISLLEIVFCGTLDFTSKVNMLDKMFSLMLKMSEKCFFFCEKYL